MDIKYNTPIQIHSEQTYNKLMHDFGGIIAGRKDINGDFWIKIWMMKYKQQLAEALEVLNK